ncbi:hypothetical protein BS17DRAFT_45698 [Gyrodon lividus]|nr:hypothetical protein BS17DRAFT_45698 [Gyrodon lividus]
MATTISPRVSTDQQPQVDQQSLVNPHALPNANANASGPDLAVHAQTRRVSSEMQSQAHGRSSPSLRTVTRRTPVPFLLEAFPAPPSHIPPSPGTSGSASIRNGLPLSSVNSFSATSPPGSVVSASSSTTPTSSPTSTSILTTFASGSATPINPPPSLPPSSPLPPIPGPSTVTPDLFITRRSLQSVRSASPALSFVESQSRSQSRAEQPLRSSIDNHEHVRGRGRKGSVSSLRNLVCPSACEQSEVIQEEPGEEEPRPPPAQAPISASLVGEEKSDVPSQRDIPDILRPSVSRKTSAPLDPPDDTLYVEDSIANIDMSDLSALKYDNEVEPDDHASRPFPRFPPLPHSQQQSLANPLPTSAPPYAHTPRKPSKSSICSTNVFPAAEKREARSRSASPEISQMISGTPRPRKRSSSRSRVSSLARDRKESGRSRNGLDAPPAPKLSPNMGRAMVARRGGSAVGLSTNGDDEAMCGTGEADDANESDSSIDLHTPLSHLMLRHGMLSPNSKLLPQSTVDTTRLSIASDFSSSSYLSNVSNISLVSTSTSSKHLKDARDTPRRRVRHRDGKLLKGGIGLTTGLGWSDSEDEDAPSPLTRRLSTLVLSRRASSSSVNSYRSSHSQSYSPHPLSRSISHSILREVDEYEDEAEVDAFGYSDRDNTASRSFPSRSKPVSRVGSTHSVGSSSLGRYSTFSTSSAPAPGLRMRAHSGSGSSSYGASTSSKTNGLGYANGGGCGLALSIPEPDDGVTPTRAAFERSSLGSVSGGTGVDLPHTPSSTTSSVSIPFPATPESIEDLEPSQPAYDKDKMLPPLPGSRNGKGKYPSNLSLKSPARGLQRPRTYSNASSVSTSSVLGVPAGNANGSTLMGPFPVPGTPRPSIGGTPRPCVNGTPKSFAPGGTPRPSINNGTPRPSLAIPRPSLSASARSSFSAVPRPITPSSAPSSANGSSSPGYAPRPLKLVPRSATLPLALPSWSANTCPNVQSDQAQPSQSSKKCLQPGEQPPRPSQVLAYNRNVHDQLKLRSLSPNGGHGRAQVMPVSPGGTQTLLIPLSGSSLSSALSTPLSSPLLSSSGESPKPKPRTGTGMVYRTNLSVSSVAPSRTRVPSLTQR